MMRIGKIARLPLAIREELNWRMLNGEMGTRILVWLNSLDAVRAILHQHFGGLPVGGCNLSQWRKGGYQEWLARREKVAQTQELARFALQLAQANDSSIADGASALAASRILKLLEAADDTLSPREIGGLVMGLGRLRHAEASAARVQVSRARLEQREKQIEIGAALFTLHAWSLYLPGARRLEREVALVVGDDVRRRRRPRRCTPLMFACRLQPRRMMPSLSNVNSRASPAL